MKAQPGISPEPRRFLVINYWIGSCDDGYLDGPVLVSTRNYEQFYLWDEPYAADLSEDEYQIIELYPRGLTYDEASRRFDAEFPGIAGGRTPAERQALEEALWQEVAHPGASRYVAAA